MSMRRSLFAARRLDRVRVRLAALWAVLLAPGQGQQGRQEWALARLLLWRLGWLRLGRIGGRLRGGDVWPVVAGVGSGFDGQVMGGYGQSIITGLSTGCSVCGSVPVRDGRCFPVRFYPVPGSALAAAVRVLRPVQVFSAVPLLLVPV